MPASKISRFSSRSTSRPVSPAATTSRQARWSRSWDRKGTVGRWGFVHSNARVPPKVAPTNAKSETILDRLLFADTLLTKRCIIPATGFYEWTSQRGKRLPHFIGLPDRALMWFAGISSVWHSGEKAIATTAIVTTGPNETMEPIHDRIPVILHPDAYDAWLDTETPLADLRALMVPYSGEMATWRVDPRVSCWKVERAELVKPLDPAAA